MEGYKKIWLTDKVGFYVPWSDIKRIKETESWRENVRDCMIYDLYKKQKERRFAYGGLAVVILVILFFFISLMCSCTSGASDYSGDYRNVAAAVITQTKTA